MGPHEERGELLGLTPGQQITKMFTDMYFGNGRPGLTTRMNDVEKAVARIVKYSQWIILLVLGLLVKEVILKIVTGKW